jgi:hypothetical protein
MNLDPGVCFQVRGEGYHLKVAVTFPDPNGKVLLFGLTGEENVEERICRFETGEHEFFTKPTVVAYRRKFLLPYSGFNESLLLFHPRMTLEQVRRIVEAAHISEDLEPRYLRMLPKPGDEMATYISRLSFIGLH